MTFVAGVLVGAALALLVVGFGRAAHEGDLVHRDDVQRLLAQERALGVTEGTVRERERWKGRR